MTISNLMLSECACKANQVSTELSAAYKTPVYVASCEQGGSVVVCENFTCPCNQTARRLLQTAPPTTLNVVYKQTVSVVKNETVITAALQVAYQKPVVVTETRTESLPTTDIVWNPVIIFYRPAGASEEPFPVGAVVGSIVAVLVVAGIGVGLYFFFASRHVTDARAKQPNVLHVRIF